MAKKYVYQFSEGNATMRASHSVVNKLLIWEQIVTFLGQNL